MRDCTLDAVVAIREGEEIDREYAPARMRRLLEERGMAFEDREAHVEPAVSVDDSYALKQLRRFIRMFHRTTVAAESMIRLRFRQDLPIIYDQIVPLLVRHGVLEERDWHGGGTQRVWALRVLLEDLLAAEDAGSDNALTLMWEEARSL